MATSATQKSAPSSPVVTELVELGKKGVTGVRVISRGKTKGRKLPTAQIIVYRTGEIPRTRHLIKWPNKGYTDEQGRRYNLDVA